MSLVQIDYAAHSAVLDPMTGSGLLVLPRWEDDVLLPFAPRVIALDGALAAAERFPVSLHEADLSAALSDLHRRGWEPLEGEDGGLLHEGWTKDGREVVGLVGLDPIRSGVSIEELAEAHAELHAAVGVVAPMPN